MCNATEGGTDVNIDGWHSHGVLPSSAGVLCPIRCQIRSSWAPVRTKSSEAWKRACPAAAKPLLESNSMTANPHRRENVIRGPNNFVP
jgi:hypothetical protein